MPPKAEVRMGGATASALASGAKAEAIPIMLGNERDRFREGLSPSIGHLVARIGEFVEADQSDLACPVPPCKNNSVFPNYLLAA